MKLHANLFALLLCGVVTLISSCKKDEADSIKPTAQGELAATKKADIRLENGYLVFKSPEVYAQAIQDVTNKNREEVAAWEKQYGFTSMRTLYEQALLAQVAAASNGKEEHADFTLAHRKMLVLHEDGTLDMNNFHHDVAALVNEDGIVKVGGHFYQYTEKSFKVLKGGDEKKLELLKQATESNEQAGITVTQATVAVPNQASNGRTSAADYSYDCWSDLNDSNQLKAEIRLTSYQQPIFGNPIVVGENCYYDEYNSWYCEQILEYPIIGYTSSERFTIRLLGGKWRKPLFGSRWFDSGQWYYKTITAYYSLNYGPEVRVYAQAYDNVALLQTIYDGPGTNISARTAFTGRIFQSYGTSFSCAHDFN